MSEDGGQNKLEKSSGQALTTSIWMSDIPKMNNVSQWFVTICHPLHYQLIMNPSCCSFLLLMCFVFSLWDSLLQNFIVLEITCFKGVEIPNFFCDPSQLFSLSCHDTFSYDMIIYLVGIIFFVFPMSGILFSYYKIVSTTLRGPSSRGMYKAFSTCGSHLTVVCLFYRTASGLHLSSFSSLSPRRCAVASVVYTVVTPMLNPFICSLSNRDIKRAVRRLLRKITSPQLFHFT
ncbi:olfactory receptor 18-like [Ochotona curzoniae]|uniref:olfactory receptor 18-like n=1 Tax=Ochotona curzoniae TaxID=130825 RepID=UPI001B345E8A|nr:olfactory receptor 18-like [Ochotona curzoniae]